MNYISFPGLGIEPFHVDKTAFTIFGREVAWYGVLITVGMVIAVLIALHYAKFEKVSADKITDLAFFVIIFGVLGARLYYVLFTWNEYPYLVTSGSFFYNLWHTFVNIIAIWNGGLAIYGGVIAGIIVALIFCKKKKIQPLKILDLLVPCVLIGQIIGRWGNFFNMEAYGTETTLPWRMGLLRYASTGLDDGLGVLLSERYVHPTFLYESLWNLIGLILVFVFYKKKKRNGQVFCGYLIWYGFGRMLIEGLRTDSLMLGSIRISQLIGLLSCVLGIVLFILFSRRPAVKDGTENEEKTDGEKVTGERKDEITTAEVTRAEPVEDVPETMENTEKETENGSAD